MHLAKKLINCLSLRKTEQKIKILNIFRILCLAFCTKQPLAFRGGLWEKCMHEMHSNIYLTDTI